MITITLPEWIAWLIAIWVGLSLLSALASIVLGYFKIRTTLEEKRLESFAAEQALDWLKQRDREQQEARNHNPDLN